MTTIDAFRQQVDEHNRVVFEAMPVERRLYWAAKILIDEHDKHGDDWVVWDGLRQAVTEYEKAGR